VGVMRLFRNGFLGSTKSTIWQTFRGFSSSGIHQETELSGVFFSVFDAAEAEGNHPRERIAAEFDLRRPHLR
jgi:hypothetical protein